MFLRCMTGKERISTQTQTDTIYLFFRFELASDEVAQTVASNLMPDPTKQSIVHMRRRVRNGEVRGYRGPHEYPVSPWFIEYVNRDR